MKEEFQKCEWCETGYYDNCINAMTNPVVICGECGESPMDDEEKVKQHKGTFQNYWDFVFNFNEKNTKLKNLQTWNYQQKKIDLLEKKNEILISNLLIIFKHSKSPHSSSSYINTTAKRTFEKIKGIENGK